MPIHFLLRLATFEAIKQWGVNASTFSSSSIFSPQHTHVSSQSWSTSSSLCYAPVLQPNHCALLGSDLALLLFRINSSQYAIF